MSTTPTPAFIIIRAEAGPARGHDTPVATQPRLLSGSVSCLQENTGRPVPSAHWGAPRKRTVPRRGKPACLARPEWGRSPEESTHSRTGSYYTKERGAEWCSAPPGAYSAFAPRSAGPGETHAP